MIISEYGVPTLQFSASYKIVVTIFTHCKDPDICIKGFQKIVMTLPYIIKIILYHCLILGYYKGISLTLTYEHLTGE